jgi:hypothetical protein
VELAPAGMGFSLFASNEKLTIISLIAIMLGRLRMDVKEGIEEYGDMISQIIKKKNLPIDWQVGLTVDSKRQS